jgi:hypothetical protein
MEPQSMTTGVIYAIILSPFHLKNVTKIKTLASICFKKIFWRSLLSLVHPELLMTLEVEEVFMVKRLLLQVIRYV